MEDSDDHSRRSDATDCWAAKAGSGDRIHRSAATEASGAKVDLDDRIRRWVGTEAPAEMEGSDVRPVAEDSAAKAESAVHIHRSDETEASDVPRAVEAYSAASGSLDAPLASVGSASKDVPSGVAEESDETVRSDAAESSDLVGSLDASAWSDGSAA
jgi:hypothetical protein